MSAKDETTMKAHVAGNRLAATFALIGAMLSLHYAYALNGWHGAALPLLAGLLASVTISRTIKAAIYASAMVTGLAIDEMKKDGMLR